MYAHSTYVVTLQRLPLGIVDAWMWAPARHNRKPALAIYRMG